MKNTDSLAPKKRSDRLNMKDAPFWRRQLVFLFPIVVIFMLGYMLESLFSLSVAGEGQFGFAYNLAGTGMVIMSRVSMAIYVTVGLFSVHAVLFCLKYKLFDSRGSNANKLWDPKRKYTWAEKRESIRAVLIFGAYGLICWLVALLGADLYLHMQKVATLDAPSLYSKRMPLAKPSVVDMLMNLNTTGKIHVDMKFNQHAVESGAFTVILIDGDEIKPVEHYVKRAVLSYKNFRKLDGEGYYTDFPALKVDGSVQSKTYKLMKINMPDDEQVIDMWIGRILNETYDAESAKKLYEEFNREFDIKAEDVVDGKKTNAPMLLLFIMSKVLKFYQ